MIRSNKWPIARTMIRDNRSPSLSHSLCFLKETSRLCGFRFVTQSAQDIREDRTINLSLPLRGALLSLLRLLYLFLLRPLNQYKFAFDVPARYNGYGDARLQRDGFHK